jgi:myo-inositol-1(or 4)-monophosphatase
VSADAPDAAKRPAAAELLDLAVRAALDAGALLLERFAGGQQQGVHAKSTPTDLVSEADLAAQRTIEALIARERPQDGFLGEEDTGGPAAGAAVSGLRWVVDPLDGTINYLFGIPQWSVSVAVEDEHGRTLAGAVFDPCRSELWTATAVSGGALNGTPIHGSERDELATALVATGFAYDARVRAAQAQVLARLVGSVRDIRRLGSAALDLAWTAAGRYDAYFERTTKPWDVAAGALICERVGVRVVALEAHPDLPAGILAAPPALFDGLLELVG